MSGNEKKEMNLFLKLRHLKETLDSPLNPEAASLTPDVEYFRATITELCTALEEAREAIRCFYAVSLNPPDDISGREMFNKGQAFLAKYPKEGE